MCVLVNSEAGVKTLTWWKEMIDAKTSTNLGRKTDDTKKAFIAGQVAMTLDSTASLRGIVSGAEGKFQVGTGFLRAPEAGIPAAWAKALESATPEDTLVSRVFSGRAGRSLATDYVRAAISNDAPRPAPYPVQRGLTAAMRVAATKAGDVSRMQAWAGQSAGLARAESARVILQRLWDDAVAILRY